MPLKEKDMVSMTDPRVTLIGHPAPAWMVNYADLMTELVCLFVILYGLSAALNKDIQEAKKEVDMNMKNEKVSGDVKVSKDGMTITLTEKGDNVFFKSGSADLSPKMKEVLTKLVPVLKKLASKGHDIVVEGHTDNVPIHSSKYSSNWQLSTARATSVVEHMIDDMQFPPDHLAAIGYGEFHPLVPNVTDEDRATNRRVVFFIKNRPPKKDPNDDYKKASDTSPPPTAPAQAPSFDAPPDNAPPANTEPTTDTSLPLPQQAPAEGSADQTTSN